MLVPGSNLLLDAFECLNTEEVIFYKDQGRVLNDQGNWVTSYSDPVTIEASVQAPDRNTYVQYGLDLQKNYLRVYLPEDTIDLSRDQSGDQMTIGLPGRRYRYQLESEIPWFDHDGWVEIYVVQINREPEANQYD